MKKYDHVNEKDNPRILKQKEIFTKLIDERCDEILNLRDKKLWRFNISLQG